MCQYKHDVGCDKEVCPYVRNKTSCQLFRNAHARWLLEDMPKFTFANPDTNLVAKDLFMATDGDLVKSWVAKKSFMTNHKVRKFNVDQAIAFSTMDNNNMDLEFPSAGVAFIDAHNCPEKQACFVKKFISSFILKNPHCVIGVWGNTFCEMDEIPLHTPQSKGISKGGSFNGNFFD